MTGEDYIRALLDLKHEIETEGQEPAKIKMNAAALRRIAAAYPQWMLVQTAQTLFGLPVEIDQDMADDEIEMLWSRPEVQTTAA